MGRLLGLLMIVTMALVFFGGKRLPDLARALGRSMRILRSETAALKDGFAEEYEKGARSVDEDAPAGGAARTIKSAPGDAATARPVAEQQSGRAR
jgi:sec-independent protein translocase protein TatA